MVKRLLIGLLDLLLVLCLCGCWSYRSLDQMNIVVGIAIDYDKNTDNFDISYETANLTASGKMGAVKGKLIHSSGKNLFSAARNAKRKEADKLFFGDSQVMIISQELARNQGILSILDWALRDSECRETWSVVISQEDTAACILEVQEDMSSIISTTLHDIIKEDKNITGTSMDTQLYRIYNGLYSVRKSALLPAVHKVQSGVQESLEVNGLAIIKEDWLAGFLSPEQSRYALMIENQLGGGIITLSMREMPGDDVSLEILKNNTNKSFTYEQGKVTVYIKTKTNVAIGENRSALDLTDKQVVEQIETSAAQMIQDNIKSVVTLLQRQFQTDAFGFGEMIYKQDLKLWRRLSPEWNAVYPTVEVIVSSKVTVLNAASSK